MEIQMEWQVEASVSNTSTRWRRSRGSCSRSRDSFKVIFGDSARRATRRSIWPLSRWGEQMARNDCGLARRKFRRPEPKQVMLSIGEGEEESPMSSEGEIAGKMWAKLPKGR